MRLELFDVSKRWLRQRTQGNNGTSFRELQNFFTLLFNSSALYYLQTPTRRYGHASMPLQFLPISGDQDVSLSPSLECMCDRHWAEITVMQLTSHSHPVHHFVAAQWEPFFYLVSYCQSSCILQLVERGDLIFRLSLNILPWLHPLVVISRTILVDTEGISSAKS